MPNIEFTTNDEVVTTKSVIELGSQTSELNVVTDNPKSVEVLTNNYILSSAGIYSSGTLDSAIPSWLSTAVDNSINTNSILGGLTNYVYNLEDGVSQDIHQLRSDTTALSSTVTANKLSSDNALAASATGLATKITETQAEGIATTAVLSAFNGENNNAQTWFANQISTYASDNLATANDVDILQSAITSLDGEYTASASAISDLYTYTGVDPNTGAIAGSGHLATLEAEVNNVKAVVTTEEGVFVGTHVWDGVEDLKIGMLKFIGDTQYQYLGGLFGENNDGWVRTDQSAIKYAAGASKLTYNTYTGGVTGWSFMDSSYSSSEFKIQADKFYITSTDGTHDPFTIDTTTGLTQFNGIVSFTNTDMTGYATSTLSNVTTIDGDKITTGTIDASVVNVTNINASEIRSGVIYNTGGTEANHTMKIDLNNGSIYIK